VTKIISDILEFGRTLTLSFSRNRPQMQISD
jgi:hypothetical protein